MTLRQAQDSPRTLRLAALAVAALLLTGCTSAFLSDGGSTAAPESTPPESSDPTPDATTPAEPEPDYDCDDIVLNRPGNYVLGACGSVTLEGTGIDLAFTSIATLVIRGDRADLVGGEVASLRIEGQGSDISVVAIGDLRIRGDGNTVLADGAIETVIVDGGSNVITSGSGVGSKIDNGIGNEIS